MKKFCALSFVMLLLFAGCSVKWPWSGSGEKPSSEEAPQQKSDESSKTESPASSKAPEENQAPNEAAEEIMESISALDETTIRELADTYFAGQSVPDSYYRLLAPISQRMTYKIGSFETDGDNAVVEMSVTSVDAQSAVNSILPGAVAHLAAMQITGKDISNPEQLLVEYAAKNINWDSLPAVTTDTKLYLVKDDNGEWEVDVNNPENLGFANAISGGGIETAQNLKGVVERFK